MIRRPPRSTLFPTRRSSDLALNPFTIFEPARPDLDPVSAVVEDTLGETWLESDDVGPLRDILDRKSTRLNSSHANISYAVFCLKKTKLPSLQYLASPLLLIP